jgi:ubiquinone/menaquinone biosynthesis C-methylase UbiE
MTQPPTPDEIREAVRLRYAEAARSAAVGGASCCGSGEASCGCGSDAGCAGETFGGGLYPVTERDSLPDAARLASLGCGNPTAVAELRDGEVVLDLGSGGGIDVLLSARRVGPTGKAYGLDMTDEMLELAQRAQREAAVENVEFLKGTIEDIPLPPESVDVIISNCVINLSCDKPRVFSEAARVLKPRGRLAVTDIVADPDLDEATRRDMSQWTGCVGGALAADAFRQGLSEAGFAEIEIRETHRVHPQAASAVIRATKPPGLRGAIGRGAGGGHPPRRLTPDQACD